MITIYACKKIITMNPARPSTTHVAVAEGRIIGAGPLKELAEWGEYTLDERFAEKYLMPGLVEGHSHTMEGMLWRHVYCGYFDRIDPAGTTHPGLKTIDDVVTLLCSIKQNMDSPTAPLAGWGIDPIYFNNRRITRHDLDRVSSTRPIGILHASVHIMNVNSCALERAGWLREGIDHPGIPLGDDGLPSGELKGPDVITPAGIHIGFDRDFLNCDEKGLQEFSRLCVRKGVTTATDLASRLHTDIVESSIRVTDESDFPVRIVALKLSHGCTPEE